MDGTDVRRLLADCGEDPDREGLLDTPDRYLEAMRFWTSGYGKEPGDILKRFLDGSNGYDGVVFQGNIPVYSLCEHHLAPFFGIVHIGYLPNPRVGVVGLSKFSRLVEIFARRLQVQERMTTQIAEAFDENLKPRAVGVIMRCRHLCMESRGVQKPGTITYTSSMLGEFRDDPTIRAEFLRFVEMADRQTTI